MIKRYRSVFRIAIYLAGMLLLVTGITLNTRLTLGVSPMASVFYCFSEILQVPFGDMTLFWYLLFIVVQIILHCIMRPANLRTLLFSDLLQLPLSLLVTRMMNLLSDRLPMFAVDCAGTFWGSLAGRLLLLVLAIVLMGTGCALTLDMRLIPCPDTGLIQTIADFTHRKKGDVKNVIDIVCILISALTSYLVTGEIIGIGIGSLIAMVGLGRVIALVGHFFNPGPFLETGDSRK